MAETILTIVNSWASISASISQLNRRKIQLQESRSSGRFQPRVPATEHNVPYQTRLVQSAESGNKKTINLYPISE